MEEESKSAMTQPITFAGVAAFGYAPFRRLLAFQFVISLLAAGVLVWLFETAWVPVVRRTISALPPTGSIEDQVLHWPEASAVRVTGSTFLSISVDPANTLEPSEGADLQVEFVNREVRFRSFLGYYGVPYPAGYILALNRTELEPWWGAWHPAVSLCLGLAVVLGLFLDWILLGIAYAWPVRLIAFYADRRISWFGAWRLAAAALLPGALFFTLAIGAYGLNEISLMQLILAFALHFLIGWAYVLASPFCLSRDSGATKARDAKNPFKKDAGRSKNPFSDASGT